MHPVSLKEVCSVDISLLIIRYAYQLLESFSFLVLASLGLAIIFGMMGVINQAHGEFIMLGAYIFCASNAAGVPYLPSVVLATVGVALYGYIIDRLIIKRLYSRLIDSVVVTWGISLIMTQTIKQLCGPTFTSPAVPLGTIQYGSASFSIYRIILIVFSVALLGGLYYLFNHTTFGLHSRATMQKSDIAEGLGINTKFTYSMTFVIGSGLAGLCGALYAPLMAVTPEFGQSFIIQSFTAVVVGGAEPLMGTLFSSGALGIVNGVLSLRISQFIGKVGMLIVAIIFIRVLPGGFSGVFGKIKIRRKK